MSYKAIIVGDTHAHPDYDNDRFELLGKFVVAEKPHEVVWMGDHRDLASLCRHASKKDIDGARVLKELEWASDAEERYFSQLEKEQRRKKKGRLGIKHTYLMGNHCVRLDGISSSIPQLDGLISWPWHKGWDNVVPFKEVYNLGYLGVACSHYFVSGQMEKAMGGVNLARKLVLKNHRSTIVGHSHILDYHEEPDAFGNTLFGLSVGHFGHLDYDEEWCKQSKHQWWNGVVVLELGTKGQLLEKREVTQRKLMEMFP